MITLHITRADDYEGVYLPLPTTPAEIGYKYLPSFRWLSPVFKIRPLLSRLFSDMAFAPFLYGKSLDTT